MRPTPITGTTLRAAASYWSSRLHIKRVGTRSCPTVGAAAGATLRAPVFINLTVLPIPVHRNLLPCPSPALPSVPRGLAFLLCCAEPFLSCTFTGTAADTVTCLSLSRAQKLFLSDYQVQSL